MTTLAVTLGFACVIFYCFIEIWRREAFAMQRCALDWKARAEFAESEAERWRLVAVAAGGTLVAPPTFPPLGSGGTSSAPDPGIRAFNHDSTGRPPRAGVDA